MTGKRSFGQIDTLPSGRHRARYRHNGQRHNAPVTFVTKRDADAWLAAEQVRISEGRWLPPTDRVGEQAKTWTVLSWARDVVDTRDIAPRTRDDYTTWIDRFIVGDSIAGVSLAAVTVADIAAWFRRLPSDTPTQRARVYGLMKTVMRQAVADELIPTDPCKVKNGGKAKRKRGVKVATPDQIADLARRLPMRLALMPIIAGWCALRYGEIVELRRQDVALMPDGSSGTLSVARGVTRLKSTPETQGVQRFHVGDPKAGSHRPVIIPASLVPLVAAHLREFVGEAPDALLFPAAKDPTRHLAPSSFAKVWEPARDRAGLPTLRFHDLRHTAGTMYTQEGATLAEVMALLGHRTAHAALIYQQVADERPAMLAERMNARVVRPTLSAS